MSGSAGGGGYEYQASAIAYVSAHILAERPLRWLPNLGAPDVPIVVAAETRGPGDDLRITVRGGTIVEVQAKRGFQKGDKYWKTLLQLATGLARDPSLYAILLVDDTASGAIKRDLRGGLARLAQGRSDGLDETTREVVERFAAEGIAHPTLFRRLSVVVADLEEGSDGARIACEILARVVVDPDQTSTGWVVLERDGLRLIRAKGQRDAPALARVLETHPAITLSATASNPAVVAARHATWLAGRTDTLSIPGLGLSLPMETAWIDLDLAKTDPYAPSAAATMEEQIIAYHDRVRRASRARDDRHLFKARHLSTLAARIALIGGPGSGKSTLLRRLAHDLALAGRRVLYVRLPRVAKVFDEMGNFEDAILAIAMDNANVDIREARRAFSAPDDLLADGLDECGAKRETIARELDAWTASRPTTNAIVATRPIGYNATLLPDWTGVDILPLDLEGGGLGACARQLLTAHGLNESAIEARTDDLERHLRDHEAVSIAARNPLLLGFLVGLSIAGIPPGRTRAELYGRVVERAYRRAERDRSASIPLDEPIATYALDYAGWRLMREPGLTRQALAEQLGDSLARAMAYDVLRGRAEAARALTFWQEQGIIEILHWRDEEAVAFVHPTLGEYAAARHVAARLDGEELRAWLDGVRRDYRWGQVILLVGGAGAAAKIVPVLLDLGGADEDESTATGAVLAAATLAEMVAPPASLMASVVDRLHPRLLSRIPAVVFEAATSMLGLATSAREIISGAARPLIGHEQRWTRLAAMRLVLACGGDDVDVGALRAIVADILDNPDRDSDVKDPRKGRRWTGGGAREFQNDVLLRGLEVLAARCPDASTVALLERAALGEATSARTMMGLITLLRRHGYGHILERMQGRWRTPGLRVGYSREDLDRVERAILEAVVRANGPRPASSIQPQSALDLGTLGGFLGEMGWLRDADVAWLAHPDYEDQSAVDAVLSGAIAAMRIDIERLNEEAWWALDHLAELQQADGLLLSLPAPPITSRWHLAVRDDPPLESLVRAVMHPSRPIAATGARLLHQYAGDPAVARLLERALENGGDQALRMVAALAPHVWKDQTRDVIIARLGGRLTGGCVYLVRALAKLAGSAGDTDTMRILLRAVDAGGPDLATEAANALANFNATATAGMGPDIERLLDGWTDRGTTCPMHRVPVHGDTHPGCFVVPPSPRAALVGLLVRVGHVTDAQLSALCGDARGDVREAAARVVVARARHDARALAELTERVRSGMAPIEVLDELLALPAGSLGPVGESLAGLSRAPDVAVRCRMMEALPAATWIETSAAVALARDATYDEEEAVRNQAADVLRALQRREG